MKIILNILLVVLQISSAFAQLQSQQFRSQEHPRVFATKEDKAALLNKIQHIQWAGKIYNDLKKQIDTLVNRHVTDPQYIISRLQMNWEDGKHYTDYYTEGNFIPRREGNAQYPTIRLTYGRSAFNSTPAPPYGKMTPYGNGDLMRLADGKWINIPFAETGVGVEETNQKIIEDAYKAGIVYYFTGDKKYAKFVADILWTFICGASYNNQVNPNQKGGFNGYLSWETLGDLRRFATLPLSLDFIHDYFFNEYFDSPQFINGRRGELWAPAHPQGKQWALDRIHLMFEKFLDNKLTRGGGLIGNWNINEHEAALLYALTLENNSDYKDNKGREYYVSQLLYGPTTEGNGAYLDVANANLEPATGLWHEPPGSYGQGSIGQMVRLGYWYFNNGIDVLTKEPVLIKAALSFPQVAFPNGYATNWGDGSYNKMFSELAELLLTYAQKTKNKEIKDKAASLLKFAGERNLSGPYYSALFFFVPELPKAEGDITLPRVSYSPDHSIVFERNFSADPNNALQYNVYGYGEKSAHRHANGMAMELYGRGEVLGVDPGWGPDYWVDQHVRYYSKAAAHNTVMPDGVAAEISKAQDLQIIHAEPEVKAGVDPAYQASPYFQFTDTYNDYATSTINADQRRLMGIVRTGKASGYFIDIFHSKTRGSSDIYHDYIYHNMGTSLNLFDKTGKPLSLTDKELDSTSGDGYTYFKDDKSLEYKDDFFGIFNFNVKGIQMKTWMLGNEGRTIYSITSPSAFRYYINELKPVRVPTLLVRQTGEAWNRPFVAVYEPYGNGIKSSVNLVRKMKGALTSGDFVGLVVERTDGKDFIANGTDSAKTNNYEGVEFKGIYGVVTTEANAFKRMYLGTGSKIAWSGYSIQSTPSTQGMVKASLAFDNTPKGIFSGLSYTSDKEVTISFPYTNSLNVSYNQLMVYYKTDKGIFPAKSTIAIPAKSNSKTGVLKATLPSAVNAQLYISTKRKKNDRAN